MPFDALVALAMATQTIGPAVKPEAKTVVAVAAGAKAGDIVTVHLVVTDPEGKELANSEKRGLPYSFKFTDGDGFWSRCAAGVLQGAEKTLTLLPGQDYQPADLAPFVPPGTTIVVKIRVVKIQKPKAR